MRTTLKAMIGLGLAVWVVTIAIAAVFGIYSYPLLILSAVIVSWSVFHLLTDGQARPVRLSVVARRRSRGGRVSGVLPPALPHRDFRGSGRVHEASADSAWLLG